jgi:hypothetical protein
VFSGKAVGSIREVIGSILSRHNNFSGLNYWVMHPVARVSINIYRNLRTQQMSVLVLLCTSYITCFGPYWWSSSGTTVFAFVRIEATEPLTYTVTDFEFFVLQTTRRWPPIGAETCSVKSAQ